MQKKRNANTLRKWKVYQLQVGMSNAEGYILSHFSYTNPNFRKPKSEIIFKILKLNMYETSFR